MSHCDEDFSAYIRRILNELTVMSLDDQIRVAGVEDNDLHEVVTAVVKGNGVDDFGGNFEKDMQRIANMTSHLFDIPVDRDAIGG
jgi:hypothetical protein